MTDRETPDEADLDDPIGAEALERALPWDAYWGD